MQQNSLAIPMAIVIAGALVAGALVYINTDTSQPSPVQGSEEITVAPIDAEDHILGNPNADITFIVYSDLECPYCKQFHQTMHQVVDAYGRDGTVAWVYRHFPIAQLHSKAMKEAEATECANELGGNEKFWEYTDRVFELTPSNNGLDVSLLPEIAEDIGLNRAAFESCLESGRYGKFVQNEYIAAVHAGGRGTPYTIVLTDGETIPIEGGAKSFETMQSVVETILGQ